MFTPKPPISVMSSSSFVFLSVFLLIDHFHSSSSYFILTFLPFPLHSYSSNPPSMDEFDSSPSPSPSPSSIHTEPVAEFSFFLHKLNPILHDLRHSLLDSSSSSSSNSSSPPPAPLHSAFHSFLSDYNNAKSTIDRTPAAKQIQHLAQNLGRSLGLVLFAAHDLPISNKPAIEILCRELMNLKFDSSCLGSGSPPSTCASEFDLDVDDDDDDDDIYEDDETEEGGTAGEEEITVENEHFISTVDEAVTEIMYGGDEHRFNEAILVLNGFVNEGMVIDQVEEDFIKLLSNRLISSKGDERTIILRMLKHFARSDDQYKVVDVRAY